MERKTIIFCQANADLLYTLDLINKHEDVIVYVINVKGIYEYLLSLDIPNLIVEFRPYFSFSLFKPTSVFKVKKTLTQFWELEFGAYKNCQVYFFSTSYDWLTATCVQRLSANNKVTYYNHYDHLTSLGGKNSFSIKRKIKQAVIKFVTNVDFLALTDVNFPKFNYQKYDIVKFDVLEKPNVEKKFLFTVPGDFKKVLFFISPTELEFLTEESRIQISSILKNIKKSGVAIVLKGHPRLGEPAEIIPIVDTTIPKNVPSEFVNYKMFDFVLGLTSAALCYPAQKELCAVYSLVQVLEFKDPTKQVNYENYIRKYSGDTIIFESEKMNAFLNKNA